MANQQPALGEKKDHSASTVTANDLNSKSYLPNIPASPRQITSPPLRSPQITSPTYPLPPPNSPSSPSTLAASNLYSLGIYTHDAFEYLGCGSAPDRFLPTRLREKGDMNPFVAGGGAWKRPGLSRGSSYSSVKSVKSEGSGKGGRGKLRGEMKKEEGKGNEEAVRGDLWEYGH